MAVNLSPYGGVGAQFLDNSGNVLTGGKIFTYAAGTTTPQVTYTTNAGNIPHPNPIILDAAGRVPSGGEIWLTDGLSYKFILRDANDVLIATYDNVTGINSNFVAFTMQQEIQTATAGQTVFTLATMQYQPGTDNLSVFVDGVNQYGPGAQYAYLETSSSSVTFVSGLHVGASVKFTTAAPVSSMTGDAANITYEPPYAGSVGTNVETKLAETVSVLDFGADPTGVSDSTIAIQAAIDALPNGGYVNFPPGTYAISRSVGTNDHWGVKITNNNVVLNGQNATLKRFNANISTYALAYPLVFVGTPDSNVADATENVVIQGLTFVGNDTQHAVSGSAINDFRCAVYAKNTVNLVVQNNTFTNVDSAVIYYQQPACYDYTNSVYYNTTKNYNSKFVKNTCVATAHTTDGRALIHAVSALGIDKLVIDSNYFEWCDDAVSTASTYDIGTVETDTFTPTVSGWSLGAVKRWGCSVVVSNNTIFDSSEHAIYMEGYQESVANNVITCQSPAYATQSDPIKIRSFGCAVTGNTVSNYGAGITVASGASDVTVSGNTVYVSSSSNTQLGGVSIAAAGLSAYCLQRINGNYWSSYRPVANISVTGNSIRFPDASVVGNTRRNIGVWVQCDSVDANFPQGQIQGLSITGNSIKSHQVGCHFDGTLLRSVVVSDNAFFAKPFTEAAFSGATTMGTRAVLQTLRNTTELLFVRFTGNTVYGCVYLVASYDGGGSAGSQSMPTGFNSNTLSFVQNIKTADFAAISVANKFLDNTGNYFLDRTWPGAGINNSLYSDNYSTGNTALRYCFNYVSGAGQVRFYTDDSGTFINF